MNKDLENIINEYICPGEYFFKMTESIKYEFKDIIKHKKGKMNDAYNYLWNFEINRLRNTTGNELFKNESIYRKRRMDAKHFKYEPNNLLPF